MAGRHWQQSESLICKGSKVMKLRGAICALVAMLVSSVVMAKVERYQAETDQLPGVDATGMLDFNNTGSGIAKATVNTRNGKARGVVRGTVPNESGKNARFKGDQSVADAIVSGLGVGITVDLKRAVYSVNKKGKASGAASGVVSIN